MKWKVLIADDEPKIRRGLRSLFERHSDSFEVVGEAEDGEVALERAVALRPDLLMVDIRMPFIDGIELIGRLETLLPGRLAVIVSGHDEFEYAQAAIKLRVFDYLLKPVSVEAFTALMARAATELGARRDSLKQETWAREQLERNLPVLRERFLKDWVGTGLARSEIEDGLSLLGIDFAGPVSLFAARFAERGEGPSTHYSHRLEQVAMRAVMEESMPGEGAYVFEDDEDAMLAIVPAMTEAGIAEARAGLARRVAELALRPVLMAARTVGNPVEGLVDAHEELRAELAEGDSLDEVVILARNYIDNHCHDADLSLESAAEALRMSPGHLSRLMKRETGSGFIEYLTRRRIGNAIALMNDPSARIAEIAERTGYRSQHYFSRAFRKVMGSSPSEYRRGWRQ
ncbi:MAG TPA: helix-turn-helix domain-containing protein [Rectinemataceae bacterium]|nr:helix-turn-helix domain-containing protein [Rectinemataceae bacterium]